MMEKVALVDFEYCSFGGILNNRSASMRDLESLWKKATSFVTKPRKKL